jgi:hypothetical protein
MDQLRAGGSAYINRSGYVMEFSGDHLRAHATSKVVPQHRLAMECYLGRVLGPHEVVHHCIGRRDDNRRENLEIHSRSTHGKLHHSEDGVTPKANLTEDLVRRALDGRTTAQAAELLGVAQMTLRRRFDHLLAKRKSPGGDYPTPFVEEVRRLASDRSVGTRMAARLLGTTVWRIRQCCRRHGIEWLAAPAGRPSGKR